MGRTGTVAKHRYRTGSWFDSNTSSSPLPPASNFNLRKLKQFQAMPRWHTARTRIRARRAQEIHKMKGGRHEEDDGGREHCVNFFFFLLLFLLKLVCCCSGQCCHWMLLSRSARLPTDEAPSKVNRPQPPYYRQFDQRLLFSFVRCFDNT